MTTKTNPTIELAKKLYAAHPVHRGTRALTWAEAPGEVKRERIAQAKASLPGVERVYDDALHLMEVQGGSFVKSLANCFYAADTPNKQRLRAAFPDFFKTYEDRFKAMQKPKEIAA